MKKFNPKDYLGKSRIYRKTHNRNNISKLWIWNESSKEYQPPIRGKCIFARKTLYENGKSHRLQMMFETIDEAVKWQSNSQPLGITIDVTPNTKDGPSFNDALSSWLEKKFVTFEDSTKGRYKQLLSSKAFRYFDSIQMKDINSRFIDKWISYLKDPKNNCWQKSSRITFKYELDLLSGILQNHINYDDSNSFQNPIKSRHYEDCKLVHNLKRRKKDLVIEDFRKFIVELEKGPHGELLRDLATVQFYQALRIHEVCGITFECINLDFNSKENSVLKITQSAIWPREKNSKPYLKSGFKNSKANNGSKIQYLYPESYLVLERLVKNNNAGLVFHLNNGIIPYKKIQYYYTRAFKKAGLEFSSTHVLRHGGSSFVYNNTGDFATGQALLGNKSVSSSQVYLHTSKKKLQESVKLAWGKHDN